MTKLTRYCGETDGLIEVTQEWVDAVQRRMFELARQREDARKILSRPFIDENNICRVPTK